MNTRAAAVAALNRLCKWRTVLTSRILGTRSSDDRQAKGVRDVFEKLLILRAETSAVTSLLILKGVFTEDEFNNALVKACAELEVDYERGFPGFKATEIGMVMEPDKAQDTMKGWPS